MKLFKKTSILILISCVTFSCKDSCPPSHTLGLFKTPEHVNDFIKYKEVDDLVFISEYGDTVVFHKTEEMTNEVVSTSYKTVPCEEDGMVELFFEREKSRYVFTSDSGDVIKFLYYPIISSLIRDYSEVNISDPQYYHYIHITFSDLTTRIREGRATWGDQETVDFFAQPLNEPFEVSGISFENVYYWAKGDEKVIFYDDDNGLIGFTDSYGFPWIRKI